MFIFLSYTQLWLNKESIILLWSKSSLERNETSATKCACLFAPIVCKITVLVHWSKKKLHEILLRFQTKKVHNFTYSNHFLNTAVDFFS